MLKRRYFGHAALAMTTLLMVAACSSEPSTGPAIPSATPTILPEALPNLTAAPAIAIRTELFRLDPFPGTLCYPYMSVYARAGCDQGAYLYISNTGGGTLNWTSTKSATWIKRSPRYGTAPSTMKVWVDGTGLPSGTYYGWIKVWATGATNSPYKVYIKMNRH